MRMARRVFFTQQEKREAVSVMSRNRLLTNEEENHESQEGQASNRLWLVQAPHDPKMIYDDKNLLDDAKNGR